MSQDFAQMAEEIVRQSSELSDDALSSVVAAALAQVCEAERSAHCKDCCCARSWEALGVNSYTGMSIVEHIEQLRAKIAAAEKVAGERDKRIAELEARHEKQTADADRIGREITAEILAEGGERAENMKLAIEVDSLRATLVAAAREQFIAGLEAAKLIVYEMPVHTRCTSQVFKMYDGIQSQIDKAKAELAALDAKEQP